MTHTAIRINRVGDGPAWPELANKKVHECTPNRFTVIERGTEGGRATVAFFIDLPDGSVAFVQTTAALFMMMAGAVRGACQTWDEEV